MELYCRFPPSGDVIWMVPVLTEHVGCKIVPTGAAGALGMALIIKFADETQLELVEFRTLMV